MNVPLLLPLVITTLVAAVSWYVAHRFSMSRDLASKRRELRVKYLIDAYRQLEVVSNRAISATTAPQFESAIADIQLFGTPQQVQLAQTFAVGFAERGTAELDSLLEALRRDLREELELLEVPAKIKFLRITFNQDQAVVQFSETTDQRLSAIARDLTAAEEALERPKQARPAIDAHKYTDEYVQILSSTASLPMKMLTAAVLFEKALLETALAIGVDSNSAKQMMPGQIVETLNQRGVLTSRDVSIFRKLYEVRNRLVHAHRQEPISDSEAARFLDLTWRFLKRLAQ